ncbi:hypothetical protein AOLI_G00243470 [Acnodon oligacanthus]
MDNGRNRSPLRPMEPRPGSLLLGLLLSALVFGSGAAQAGKDEPSLPLLPVLSHLHKQVQCLSFFVLYCFVDMNMCLRVVLVLVLGYYCFIPVILACGWCMSGFGTPPLASSAYLQIEY